MAESDESNQSVDAPDERDGRAGEYATERSTAPQSPYSTRDVAIGFVVLAVGLLITFAIPLVLG